MRVIGGKEGMDNSYALGLKCCEQEEGSLGGLSWQLMGCILQLLKRMKLEKTKYYKMEEKWTFLITLSLNLIKITKVGWWK